MKHIELMKELENRLNKEDFSADDIYRVATGLLNSIVLRYIDNAEITRFNFAENKRDIEDFISEIITRVHKQLWTVSHLYITKDNDILNQMKEETKEANLSIADEIDEHFIEIRKKLNFGER